MSGDRKREAREAAEGRQKGWRRQARRREARRREAKRRGGARRRASDRNQVAVVVLNCKQHLAFAFLENLLAVTHLAPEPTPDGLRRLGERCARNRPLHLDPLANLRLTALVAIGLGIALGIAPLDFELLDLLNLPGGCDGRLAR